MERQSERLRQSSDDLIETRETDACLYGLKGILVWRRVVHFGAVAWEFDSDLTAKINGCTFKKKAEKFWNDRVFK